MVLYNGMPLQREQLDPDELETVVMHKILETTSFFQRTVYLVRITCVTHSLYGVLFGLKSNTLYHCTLPKKK